MAKGEKKSFKRRLAGAYVSSVISISLVLLLIGISTLLLVNARKVSDYFKESMQISLIFRQDIPDSVALGYKAGVDSLPYVRSAVFVSKEQGAAELSEMLGEDFLDVFQSSPVPASVDVSLKAEYVHPDSLGKILPALGAVPGVDDVQSRQSVVEALNRNISGISLVMGVFILLMLFISVVLISNTVRLSVFARRFTIHTMSLVGATAAFIRKPFMRSAALQGFISAVLSCIVLGAGLWLLHESFPQMFSLLHPGTLALTAAVMILCGVLICSLTTFFVVGRILSSGKDALYY